MVVLNHYKLAWLKDCSSRIDFPLRQAAHDLFEPLDRYPRFLHNWLTGRYMEKKRLSVILTFHHHQDSYRDGLLQVKQQLASYSGCRITYEMPHLYSCSALLTPAAIQELLSPQDCQSRIIKLSLDRVYTAQLEPTTSITQGTATGASSLQVEGLTGEGITIALLDTGIHPHDDFTKPYNRILLFEDLVNGRLDPYDDNGHGTHLAGCMAGNGFRSATRHRGIAPAAQLVVLKVLDRKGRGALSTIMAALNWCIEHRDEYGIRVVNLSLGSPVHGTLEADPFIQAVEAASNVGLAVLTASGTIGTGWGTATSPAGAPSAISVGMEELGASGQVSPRSPSSYIDRMFPELRVNEDYCHLGGTSVAAAMGSGAAALLLQRTPGLQPAQLKEQLMELFRVQESQQND